MTMLYLLLKLCSVLVETFGRVPQPKEAIVGRPLKWAQSGCLLPHFWSESCWEWNNYFQVDPRRSSGLQAHHDVGFHCTHCVPADEFRKAIGCLEFLIQSQTQSRGVFVGELDCPQYLVNRVPLQPFKNTLGTSKGNLLRGLYGASFFFPRVWPMSL